MAKVLIVDDQPDIRRVLSRLVRLAGHDSVEAGGGTEALESLAGPVPDLILLDIMMPDVDGFEVLRRVREDARVASVPVIMFSALSAGEIKERALGLGANDYWVKGSLTADFFCERLAEHLGTGIG